MKYVRIQSKDSRIWLEWVQKLPKNYNSSQLAVKCLDYFWNWKAQSLMQYNLSTNEESTIKLEWKLRTKHKNVYSGTRYYTMHTRVRSGSNQRGFFQHALFSMLDFAKLSLTETFWVFNTHSFANEPKSAFSRETRERKRKDSCSCFDHYYKYLRWTAYATIY